MNVNRNIFINYNLLPFFAKLAVQLLNQLKHTKYSKIITYLMLLMDY